MSTFFEGKRVIITGSSMGIGKMLAIEIGKLGGKVIINGRNALKLQETENNLKENGIDVLAVEGDITKTEVCRQLIQATIRQYGGIDILINNAGSSMRGQLSDLMPGVIETVYNVNAVAPSVLSGMAAEELSKTKGSIVFISSLAGLRGLPFLSIYSAAKMSLTAIAQSLRIELKSKNVHVGIVYVGITEIEKDKYTIGKNGEKIYLEERKGVFTESILSVTKKIIHHIQSRKNTTVIGIAGKFYFILNKFFPGLLTLMIARSAKQTEKLYK